MKISRELYQTMQNQTAPKSKSWKNIPLAFLTGGLICTIGEAGIHILTEFCGVSRKQLPRGSLSGWWQSVQSALVWAGTPSWANTPEPARWCPLPALQTVWFPLPLRHAQRAGSSASAPAFLPLRGQSFSTALPLPWYTG